MYLLATHGTQDIGGMKGMPQLNTHTHTHTHTQAPITDAADAGAAHGAVGIDHVWQRRLQQAMDETVPPVSFEDAVLPLSQHFPEIDFEDLRAIAQGLREV